MAEPNDLLEAADDRSRSGSHVAAAGAAPAASGAGCCVPPCRSLGPARGLAGGTHRPQRPGRAAAHCCRDCTQHLRRWPDEAVCATAPRRGADDRYGPARGTAPHPGVLGPGQPRPRRPSPAAVGGAGPAQRPLAPRARQSEARGRAGAISCGRIPGHLRPAPTSSRSAADAALRLLVATVGAKRSDGGSSPMADRMQVGFLRLPQQGQASRIRTLTLSASSEAPSVLNAACIEALSQYVASNVRSARTRRRPHRRVFHVPLAASRQVAGPGGAHSGLVHRNGRRPGVAVGGPRAPRSLASLPPARVHLWPR